MKKKLLIIIILIVLFLIFLGIRFYFFNKDAAMGRVRIMTSPSAGVFVDNVAVGKTPFESTLKPGEYQIKLIPEGENTKTVSWQGKVQLHANALTYVSRELGTSELTSAGETLTITKMEKKPTGEKGELYIETEPAGGIVYLDNDQKGIAPIRLQDVPVGDHEVSVYLPGFFRRSQKIHIEKAYTLNAAFKLALDKSHKTLEDEVKEKEVEASQEAKRKEEEEKKISPTKAAAASETTLTILDTPTGFLNVRSEPSTAGEIITTVDPGDEFEYTGEQDGWYEITTPEGSGWVSGDYVELQ